MYKKLKRTFKFSNFDLNFLHIQGDPFADGSRLELKIKRDLFPITDSDLEYKRRIGFEDAILRGFANTLKKTSKSRGSGKSGEWRFCYLGQKILPRVACEITKSDIFIRFSAGLPADGRKILAHEASEMIFDDLVKAVEQGIFTYDFSEWKHQADLFEDQCFVRQVIKENDWLGFIANGSRLARQSGVDDRPLSEGNIAWSSPEPMEVEINLPHCGKVTGSALRKGITLICGGGFHGKSTLLKALTQGIYHHIADDGREFCLMTDDAVSIKAEEGRSINHVDISSFIDRLPSKKNTHSFSTSNASGSTSQAANICEAIAMGASCLLFDEDTSATNFLIRDRRMQEFIERDFEPITPFVDRVEEIYEKTGVSCIFVMGGLGDYLEKADQVIVMREYKPLLETKRAQEVAGLFPTKRKSEAGELVLSENIRTPSSQSLRLRKGRKEYFTKAVSQRDIILGEETVDVGSLDQIISIDQLKTIADWIAFIKKNKQDKSIRETVNDLEEKLSTSLLSNLVDECRYDRVWVRPFELIAVLNRVRHLTFK